jgi:uncharacterized iron-regulated protein
MSLLQQMSIINHKPGTWLDPQSQLTIPHHELIAFLDSKRVVLLGETHDRFDIHRWQLHVASSLLTLDRPLIIGFEMFPRSEQAALDQWVAGELSRNEFIEKSNWATVWGFAIELYMPIFDFCRQFKIPMKALNCRRSLVTEVGKLGWDAIAIEDRDGLTPAKDAGVNYREYLFNITGAGNPNRKATSASNSEFDRFIRAQQTWDRAFACNIEKALKETPDALIVGIIGRGHLEFGYGTPYQLADLGIHEVSVLLPSDNAAFDVDKNNQIAEAVFRLDSLDKAVRER